MVDPNKRNDKVMALSIVIVNWNSKEFVRKCLLSLREHCSDLSPQIIVVDGGSFDGCDVMIEKEFPKVEFVQSENNIGFGRSNNLGVEKAKGEALLLLNPDTEVFKGSIQALLHSLHNLEKVGIVGAKQLNSDGSLQLTSIFQLPRPWRHAFTTARSHQRYWQSSGALNANIPIVVEAISGACMMMKRELFEKVGGFTPAFFMYAEDMDLCLKVTKAGYLCYHNPQAVITHHAGGSTSSPDGVSRFSTIIMREALNLYFKREVGLLGAIQFRAASFLSAVIRIMICFFKLMFFFRADKSSKVELNYSLNRWIIVLRWTLGLEKKFVKKMTSTFSENCQIL